MEPEENVEDGWDGSDHCEHGVLWDDACHIGNCFREDIKIGGGCGPRFSVAPE